MLLTEEQQPFSFSSSKHYLIDLRTNLVIINILLIYKKRTTDCVKLNKTKFHKENKTAKQITKELISANKNTQTTKN
ncbi:hypothetical protein [Sphingobacterium bambusae]|uniref:Uncharacterized protein n=1 Tax=Sphingobacterium bambusae TaxID=662858 RepID=A0ABW6BBD8_9SPHI|nr:hypothetical protein [Sphingobacterium bambusae]WPL46931.1 hypothetical protein SCB77_13260 [Sphingobacterium bambusae]